MSFISQENTHLSFTAVSYRAKFGDKELEVLSAVAEDVVDLDLSSTQVTDAAASQLKNFVT
ncbi:hypothetical protein [Rubritalea tangerina]|uniref:hypothetical protein n=1 Tax=Rubritalea tangerina TaxID=430798 RepID=UPI003605EBDA